jgi:hypothetical protein
MTEDLAALVRVMLVDNHAPFRRAMAFVVGRESDLEGVAHAGGGAGGRGSAGLGLLDSKI